MLWPCHRSLTLVSASALRDFGGPAFVLGLCLSSPCSLLAEHCLYYLCAPAMARATEALEIGLVQVLTWQLEDGEGGEECQPLEKAEEAAAGPAGAAGSAGSVRPPERGLRLLLSPCLLRGELVGNGTPSLQSYCALKFHWYLVQKFHAMPVLGGIMIFFLPLLLRKMKMLTIILLLKPRRSWLHSLGRKIPTLFYIYICI